MKEPLTKEERREQHLDALIRLAFEKEEEEAVRQLSTDPDADMPPEMEQAAMRAFTAAMEQAEKDAKENHSKEKKAKTRRLFFRVVEIAACLVLLAGIALPVAVATSAEFRSKVMQLLVNINMEKGEAEISFEPQDDTSFLVPQDWKGEYFPSYIPSDYYEYSCSQYLPATEYRLNEISRFIFMELDESYSSTLGTDGAATSSIVINGRDAFALIGEVDGIHIDEIVWSIDDRWFQLFAYDMEKNEVQRIAESVHKIIK